MKRILLHIGYPKTGTTTIQNTLFYNLHNSGSINFLGKARYVDDISINKQHNLINSFINDRISIDDLKIDLLPDKLNVYSNEGSAKVSELDRAKKFFKIFQPDINDVRLLVTLRNQPDLIYSLFVDQHRPGKRIEYKTMEKYFEYIRSNKENNYRGLYFYDALKSYAELFGIKKIYFLFFEDLQNQEAIYYKTISELLDVDASIINDTFNKEHFYKKKKTSEGYYVSIKKQTVIKKIYGQIGAIIGQNSYFKNQLLKMFRNAANINGLEKIIKAMLYNVEEIFIPKLSSKEINDIRDEFKGSNLKLSKKYNLKTYKLKKYGYI